jgi:hypothetical protein
VTEHETTLCAEPRCPAVGVRWQDGARWCPDHWVQPVPTPDVALATLWEPAHVELPGRRKVTPPPNSKEQPSDA